MDKYKFSESGQMAQIRADFSSRNVEGINSTLPELRESLDNATFQAKLTPLLREAVETNSSSLVYCFLENHVQINSQLVVKATMNTSYQTLEAFLNNGWDINAPVDSNTPPALA